MCAEQAASTLSGEVEVDGAYFGGYVKRANRKEDRVDRRRAQAQTGKRQVAVVMREHETLTHIATSEAAGAAVIAATVAEGSAIYADEPQPMTISLRSS